LLGAPQSSPKIFPRQRGAAPEEQLSYASPFQPVLENMGFAVLLGHKTQPPHLAIDEIVEGSRLI
jgi:hypothetical protein